MSDFERAYAEPVYDEPKVHLIKSVPEQQLEALLRIEVLLTSQLEGMRFLAKALGAQAGQKAAEEAPKGGARRK